MSEEFNDDPSNSLVRPTSSLQPALSVKSSSCLFAFQKRDVFRWGFLIRSLQKNVNKTASHTTSLSFIRSQQWSNVSYIYIISRLLLCVSSPAAPCYLTECVTNPPQFRCADRSRTTPEPSHAFSLLLWVDTSQEDLVVGDFMQGQ